MKKITNFSATPSRKSTFASFTMTVTEGGKDFVIKKALLPEGKEHIKKLLESHTLLETLGAFDENITLVPVELRDSAAIFPYVKGRSTDNVLINHMLAGDKTKAEEIISKLIDFVSRLPCQNINPTKSREYVKVFGENYNRKTVCITPGIIDLNFDNFIIDFAGKWHLIDYEWVYDFPVPKDYVLRRFIFWFFTKNFGNYTSLKLFEDTGFLEIGEGALIPSYWAAKYKRYLLDSEEFVQTEHAFQNYVNTRSDRFWKTPRSVTKQQAHDILNEKLPEERFELLETTYLKLEKAYLATREQLDKLTDDNK